MTRRPNFAKFMLGVFVLALLFIGTWGTTRTARTAKKPKASTTEAAASTNPTTALNLSAPLTPPLVPITSVFELDGNIKQDGALDDWGNVNCPLPGGSGGSSLVHTGVIVDGLDLTIFTGGGSKDINDVTDWLWKNGNVPPKDEILNSYAAKYAPNILVFGAERITTSGSAFIGVWFFQQDVAPIGEPTAGFSGAHEAGDVLVLNEFDSGGATTASKVFKWITDASQCNPALGEFIESTNLCDITNSAPLGSVVSVTNTVPLTLADQNWCWTYENSSGGTTMDSQAFFEGGIDLDAFPALAGTCFASFLIETRSSFETNAQLKDFAGGSFNTCVDVSLTKTATDVCEGTATTYTYTVTNTGAIPANFTLTDDNETGPYTEPFDASQIQADDIDVGADNNCTTQVGAGTPTSFMLAAGAQRIFVCTISQTAGTHNNTAQTTASSGGSTASAVASATADVFVNPVAVAGGDQSVCNSTGSHVFSLDATAGTTVPPGGTIEWTGTGITFGSPNSLTTTATVNAFGTFTATLTIKSPNTQTPACPDGVDTLTLTLSQNPTASAGDDQSACEDTASHVFNLVGTGTVPDGSTITWSGAGIVFGSPNSLTTTATVSAFGSFTATLTITNPATGTGCVGASDDLILTLNQNPQITIADVACNAADGGTSISLVAMVTAGGSAGTNAFVWKNGGVVIPGQTTDTLNVTTPGVYTVEVTRSHTDGSVSCTNSKSKNVGLCAADAAP